MLVASASVADPTYAVELSSVGSNQLSVIKVLRDVTGLGLKEAKEVVERAPTIVKQQIKQAQAEVFAGKLRQAGATAVVVPFSARPGESSRAAKSREAGTNARASPARKTGAKGQARGSTVTLEACGPNKLAMIKIVREATGLGLKAAKDLVEHTPRVVIKGAPAADAEALANRLQFAGGTAKVTVSRR